MKRWTIIAIAAAQVALLAFIAGQREWVLNTGRTVWLRSAPVDPSDPMRGAYVRLGYDISRVPRALCRDGLAARMDELKRLSGANDWRKRRDAAAKLRDLPVYAMLREGPHGIAELIELSDRRPESGVYLRGRAESWSDDNFVSVRYGIEALFLQQDKSKHLEIEAGKRMRADGVRLDAEVAVNGSGLAVLKGSRWEPLGITSETETAGPASVTGVDMAAQPTRIDLGKASVRRSRSGANRDRAIVAVTVVLKNHGEKPLAIWAPGDGRAFRLVPRKSWGESRCRWIGADVARGRPEATEIVVMQPGESRKMRFDLAASAWALCYAENEKAEDMPTSVPGLEELDVRNWSFRFEYVPPTPAECVGLPGAELLWQKSVQTRGFSPTSEWSD